MGGSQLESAFGCLNSPQQRLPEVRPQVDVWVVDIRRSLSYGAPALSTLLSTEEQRRARRYAFERERRRYVCAHAVLRLLLGRYLRRPPAQVAYSRTFYGKPCLADAPELHFNLSHAGDIVLVGVTAAAPLGVDVEPVRALSHRDAMVREFFSPEERTLVASSAAPERDAMFFGIWTCKEATVKAAGTGLSTAFADFAAFASGTGEGAGTVRGLAGSWTLRTIRPADGYCAAVAVAASDVALSVRRVVL